MSDEIKSASKTIVLNDSAIQKIDLWLDQIGGKRVTLSRKEFLNWFIEKMPENLSNSDLGAIVDRYYDEEKFLRQLLRETRQAKKNGLKSNLEIVVRPKRPDSKREAAASTNDETSAPEELGEGL